MKNKQIFYALGILLLINIVMWLFVYIGYVRENFDLAMDALSSFAFFLGVASGIFCTQPVCNRCNSNAKKRRENR